MYDVLVGADLLGKVEPWGDLTKDVLVGDRFPFATDKVIYEGQEVAAVVAEARWQAQDAIDAIHVEYETLPAVVDPEAAMDPDAPLVQDTIAYEFGAGNTFDAEIGSRSAITTASGSRPLWWYASDSPPAASRGRIGATRLRR